jgi:hypothetical protein
MVRLVTVVSVVFGLVGCGSAIPSQFEDATSHIESANFTTMGFNPSPNVDVTVTGNLARDIYQAMIALSLFPSEPVHTCPAGGSYDVTFYGTDTQALDEVASAVVVPYGCQGVQLSLSAGSYIVLVASDEFWSDLATDLGIDEATIYPYPPSSP